MQNFKTGAAIASAAAVLALSSLGVTAPAQAHKSAKVQPCYGVNACKGQSDCKQAGHDCKGMNSCKGQGFKTLTARTCKSRHGSLTAKA